MTPSPEAAPRGVPLLPLVLLLALGVLLSGVGGSSGRRR